MKGLHALDPAFEHRARLAIAVLLARHGEISFARFKQELELTDGNLGAHIETLAKTGYVSVEKAFVAKRPQTTVIATPAGRAAFARHVALLREIIETDR